MKSRFLMCFAAITLFAAMAMPVPLAAQDHTKHRKHKLIDLGTFGGPQNGVFGRNEVTGRETIPSTPPGPTFKTLVNFDGANGANPGRPPIQGPDGNLYGTTPNGGANGHGELFKMTPAGALTPLYSFCPETGCADGSGPSTLVLGADGNFYGDAANGGTSGGYGVDLQVQGRRHANHIAQLRRHGRRLSA